MEVLGAAWGHLGVACGGREAVWAPLRKVLGRLETILGSSWSRLEVLGWSWSILWQSGGVLGWSWVGLGPSWSRLRLSWGDLGPSCVLELTSFAETPHFEPSGSRPAHTHTLGS